MNGLRKQVILKAAVPVTERAITTYKGVHSIGRHNSSKTHRRFLNQLHSVLPEGCRSIVVTGAGFWGPWFRDVDALGSDRVGRMRNCIKDLKPDNRRV